MSSKKIYITASACISAQHTFGGTCWHKQTIAPQDHLLPCLEPDYKAFVDAKSIRRLNRMQKMGIAAAMQCLRKAQIDQPDGIVVGTGWGCIDSTYQFLDKLYNLQGLPVNPSAFIQSTHNTIAAQIAIQLQCRNYNNTFTDNRLAFELALDDALLYMQESDAQYLLLGAVDEFISPLADIVNYVHNPNINAVFGEGSVFFMLSAEPVGDALEIKHSAIGHTKEIEKTLPGLVSAFSVNQVFVPDRKTLRRFSSFEGYKIAFEEYCGSYPTSSAFGLWLAADCVAHNYEAETFGKIPGDRNVLLYTPSKNGLCSVIIAGKP